MPPNHQYLFRLSRSSGFNCLFVCLLAGLRQNYWPNLYETWWKRERKNPLSFGADQNHGADIKNHFSLSQTHDGSGGRARRWMKRGSRVSCNKAVNQRNKMNIVKCSVSWRLHSYTSAQPRRRWHVARFCVHLDKTRQPDTNLQLFIRPWHGQSSGDRRRASAGWTRLQRRQCWSNHCFGQHWNISITIVL